MPRDFDDQREAVAHDARGAGQVGDDAGSPARPRRRWKKRLALGLVGVAALGVGLWQGERWWTVGRFMVETDDAYVHADFAVMAPKVSGYVAEVAVEANERVHAGDALVRIEDGDYRNALDAAEAQLSAQRAAITRADRETDAARAEVAQAVAQRAAAEATQVQAEADLTRYDRLNKSDFASAQRLEAARAARATAEARVQEAEATIASAKAELAVDEARRVEAQAALAGLQAARDRAARDLDATVIRAPFDGVIGNRAVAQGDYVSPGERLLAVVPLDGVYVDANFKETQLARLRKGAPVEISVDAFPDRKVIGHVKSFAPASGSVFSLLPAENATGNFTKVVQRVPVRIVIPPEIAAEGWLRPGLSVIATADTREGAAQAGAR